MLAVTLVNPSADDPVGAVEVGERDRPAPRPGGTLVTVGATSGAAVDPELPRVFLNQIRIQGVAIGTADELRRLAVICAGAGLAPTIDSRHALADARDGIRRMVDGAVFGKVVFRCSE